MTAFLLRYSGKRAPHFRSLGFGCVAFWAGLAAFDARAGDFANEVWVNPGFYSQHFDRSARFRSDNWGVGAEWAFATDHAVMAGSFINSDSRRSQYGAYLWRPWHWTLGGFTVGAGAAATVINGYPNYRNGDWFVAAMPVLSIEGQRFGANVIVVPTIKDRVQGAIAVQFKIRVW